jgi:hypothetical protein
MDIPTKNHLPECISSDTWPSASPEFNPLAYKLWSVSENMVCTRRLQDLESLKQTLVEPVDYFPMDFIRTPINEWANRLGAVFCQM